MRIVTFASGSSGNSALISVGETHVLVDAGISARRIQKNLALLGLQPSDVDAVVITHEHSDHISGLQNFLKHTSAPVFAPPLTSENLRQQAETDRICAIPFFQSIQIGEISVSSFPTPHDTPDSCGYHFESSVSFGLATDSGHVTEEMVQGLSGSDAVLIEANHDENMLKNGPYPARLKLRILSERGHLSNRCCGMLASRLYASGTRKFILGHLSKENNLPELALSTVKKELCKEDTQIFVAPRCEPFTLEIPEK